MKINKSELPLVPNGDHAPSLANGHAEDCAADNELSGVPSESASSRNVPKVSVGPLANGKDEDAATAEVNGDKDKKEEQEVVFIQDLGFMVKIVSPGTEAFDIQVSSMELVQEIHQLLMDREDTCHRTCFSLQLDGNTLDNFAELKNVEGLKEGSVIKVSAPKY